MRATTVLFPGAFVVGLAVGVLGPGVPVPPGATTWTLWALILAVGVTVGTDPEAFAVLGRRPGPVAAFPFVILAASMAAGAVVALLWPGMVVREAVAVTAGVGYYSLTGLLATQYVGPGLGVVALLANLLRETVTLVAAPWLARIAPEAPAAAGGATAMDTTLGVVAETSGRGAAVVAVYSGAVLTAAVPVVVTLLLAP